MKRKLVFTLIASLALAPFGAAWATTLSLTGPGSVAVGSFFEEKLWVTQTEKDTAGAYLGIGDFEVGISFSGASFAGYGLGTSLGDWIAGEALDLTDLANPPADLAELSLLPVGDLLALQGNQTLLLATLYFQCTGPGVSSFSIVPSSNSGLFTLGDANGNALQFGTAGNRVQQGGAPVIPEPGTLVLFATGLLGGAFVRRRAKK